MKGWFLFNYGLMLDNLTEAVAHHADRVWTKKSVLEYAAKNNLLQAQEFYGHMEEEEPFSVPQPNLSEKQQRFIVLQGMLNASVELEYYEVAELLKKEIKNIK